MSDDDTRTPEPIAVLHDHQEADHMTRDPLKELERQHAAEDRQRDQERAAIDRRFTAREADIDREAQRREESRQRQADRPHNGLEDALEAKLAEAGRAIVDKVQEAAARREVEQKAAQLAAERAREDAQREAQRREEYAAHGVQVQRHEPPASERDSRQQYRAEVGEGSAYGRTMAEAAQNARVVDREQRDMQRTGWTDEQRRHFREELRDRDR